MTPDEIKQFAEKCFGDFLAKTGGNMLVTKSRLDAWLIKGFDGISDMILTRSNTDDPIKVIHVDALKKAIDTLQSCLDSNQESSTVNLDWMLFHSVFMFSIVL